MDRGIGYVMNYKTQAFYYIIRVTWLTKMQVWYVQFVFAYKRMPTMHIALAN
jgi:hypothetical protein